MNENNDEMVIDENSNQETREKEVTVDEALKETTVNEEMKETTVNEEAKETTFNENAKETTFNEHPAENRVPENSDEQDNLDDEKLTITSTPSNQGEGFYTSLYGEYIGNVFSGLEFSNFIGYIDENNENMYYITDSYVQSILGYICYFELDSTTRSLRNLRLEVTDWDKHEFTLHFDAYNPTSNLDLGTYKASFSNVNQIVVPSVDNYLDYGAPASEQTVDDLKTVLEKFKGHNYSMDVISDSGIAKVYYTPNYYFLQVYGAPASNEGFIKEGNSIYEFTLSYDSSYTNITGINIDRSRDYATLGMTLPGCGTYYGDYNTDLFYFSAFDDAIYNYENYTKASFMGFDYWMNTTEFAEEDSRINFSNAVLKYFYPYDTSRALPQGAGFMVRNGDTPYTTRVSLVLTYSSSDGLNYGGQITTFYDIGGTRFEYLENYIINPKSKTCSHYRSKITSILNLI